VYVGLTISIVLHLGLLAWAVVSVAETKPHKPPQPEPVEVAIITPDDLVRLRKGDRSSKKLETRPAKQTNASKAKKPTRKPARTVKRPPVEAPPEKDPIADKLASLAEPKVDPAEEARKAAAAKAKAQAEAKAKAQAEAERKRAALAAKRKAEAEAKAKAEAAAKAKAEAEKKKKAAAEKKRKAEAERKRKAAAERKRKAEAERKRKLAEEQKRKAFDPGKISALLNKIPDSEAPPAGSWQTDAKPNLPTGAAAGAPEGKDTRLTASEVSMIAVMMKSATARCWNINSGLEGAANLVVDVEVRLRDDGSIDGTPRVTNMRSDPAFRDAADSAMRALIQCAPYDLPRKFYKGGWDHMVVTFDPQRMFR